MGDRFAGPEASESPTAARQLFSEAGDSVANLAIAHFRRGAVKTRGRIQFGFRLHGLSPARRKAATWGRVPAHGRTQSPLVQALPKPRAADDGAGTPKRVLLALLNVIE